LQQLGNEKRDIEVGKLRKRYESKLNTLEKRLLTATQAVERESEQATSSKLNTALSVGTAILGAVLGRKKLSVTTASRAGTAMRKAGDMQRQTGDVKRAEAKVIKTQEEIAKLSADFEAEVEAMDDAYDAQAEELQEVLVRARSSNIQIKFFGLGWRPEIEPRP
jgi:adenine-specific DNA methylase